MTNRGMFVPGDPDWYDRKLDCFLAVQACVEEEFKRLSSQAQAWHETTNALEEKLDGNRPLEGESHSVVELIPTDGGLVSRSELDNELPYIARNGLYLAAFGFAEDALRDLAEAYPAPSRIKVRDLRGYGLEPLTNYLRDVRNLNLTDGLLRGDVKALANKTRHILVHRGSQLDEGSDDLQKFSGLIRGCNVSKLLVIDSETRVKLNTGFLRWFVQEAKKAIKYVITELVPSQT